MKNIYLAILLSFSVLCLHAQDVLPVPNPPRLVVDQAQILSAEQQALLEQQLVMLDDSSSNQIAIVTIPTLNDYPIEDYANKLFRTWGIGGKKNNNGVLILVAVKDRKIRIEVGYGLEGAIPDIIAKSIINNDLQPNFKQGNYYQGFINAAQSISLAAIGEYKEKRKKDKEEGSDFLVFAIILFIVLIILAAANKGGGNKGGMMSRRGYSDIPTALLLSGLLGGGGGRSSGGFGGGGFGGFGGGSSGGGGASGGW